MTIHPSLWRPITLFGVEVLTFATEVILGSVIVVMGGLHPLAILTAAVFVVVLHVAALAVARMDPLLPWLYLRSLRHPDYFPARPRLGAPSRPAVISIPRR